MLIETVKSRVISNNVSNVLNNDVQMLMPRRSCTYLGFFFFSASSISRLLFLCTVIHVIIPLRGDRDRRKWCLELLWLHIGRFLCAVIPPTSPTWCWLNITMISPNVDAVFFSTEITLWHQIYFTMRDRSKKVVYCRINLKVITISVRTFYYYGFIEMKCRLYYISQEMIGSWWSVLMTHK